MENDELNRRLVREAVAKVLSDPSLSKSAMTAAGLTLSSALVRHNRYGKRGSVALASGHVRQSCSPIPGNVDPLSKLSERSRMLGINKWAT